MELRRNGPEVWPPWSRAESRPLLRQHGGARGRRATATGAAAAAPMPGTPSARLVRRRLKRGANATSGRPGTVRGGVSGAASGRRGRPVAGGAGRAARRALPCGMARHRRRPVPKCGEKSEAEPGRGWDRERDEAKAACTPPSRRAPRDHRVRASPSGHAFRNTAPWKPGAGRAGATAFHLRIDANGLFAVFRDVAAPKSGECPRIGSAGK